LPFGKKFVNSPPKTFDDMENSKELKLVERYAAKKGYDRVYLFYTLDNTPIFRCARKTSVPCRTGLPHLVSVKANKVRRLDDVTVRYVINEALIADGLIEREPQH